MRKMIGMLGVVCVLAAGVWAQEAEEGWHIEADAAEQQIDELVTMIEKLELAARGAGEGEEAEAVERQIMELDRQIGALARRADQLREFAEIRAASREHLGELLGELRDLQADALEEEEPAPAFAELRAVRTAYMTEVAQVLQKSLALEDPDDLAAAYRLRGELEALETKWHLVLGPKFDGAAMIYGFEEAAADLGNPPALMAALEKVKELHRESVEAGERLYALWLARAKAEAQLDRAADEFGRLVDEREALGETEREPPG